MSLQRMGQFDCVFCDYVLAPEGWFISSAPDTIVRRGEIVNTAAVRVTNDPYKAWKFGSRVDTLMVVDKNNVERDSTGPYIRRYTPLVIVSLGKAYA